MEFVDSGDIGNVAGVLNEALHAFKGEKNVDGGEALEPQATKEGLFEWIVGFDGISEYLQPLYTGVRNPDVNGLATNAIYKQNVLVIGCGTSTLSQCIAEYKPPEGTPPQEAFLAGKVVSIDNDPGMIDHMKKMTAVPQPDSGSACSSVAIVTSANIDRDTTVTVTEHDDKAAMEWLVYDIVENFGALEGDSHTGAYDLCVDKGTFDAVVTEGAVYTMLADIHRLLRCGGAYFLCSIRQSALLERLLSVPALGWDVSLHCPGKTLVGTTEHSSGYTIAVCRKARSPKLLPGDADLHAVGAEGALSPVQLRALQQQEQEVMDAFFKEASPLLTAEVEGSIRLRFDEAVSAFSSGHSLSGASTQRVPFSRSSKDATLPLRCCYDVMFPSLDAADGGPSVGDLSVDYTYDLFLEDSDSFAYDSGAADAAVDAGEIRWGVEQCIAFLREMQ